MTRKIEFSRRHIRCRLARILMSLQALPCVSGLYLLQVRKEGVILSVNQRITIVII